MTMPNGATKNGRNHGNGRVSVPVRFGRVSDDPVLDDLLASATALSLELSASGVKQLASAGAISGQSASRWRIEGRGNPLFDVTKVIYRLMQMGQHAGTIVAHALTTLQHGLMPTDPAELVARFWELMSHEAEAEGAENRVQNTFARSGDLLALERATLDEMGTQAELAAVCRELRRRRIDPRNFGGQA